MKPLEALRSVLRQYVTLSGRARRSELWWWVAALVVLYFLFGFLDATARSPGLSAIISIVYLLVIMPWIAVTVRRLHDTGRSGWWWFLTLSGVGTIVIVVFACLDSQPGTNRYGPSPKVDDDTPVRPRRT